MLTVRIFSIGSIKKSRFSDLYLDYEKRMQWKIENAECKDDKALIDSVKPHLPLFILDENGVSVKSSVFAKHIQTIMNNGDNVIQIVIGGADGLPDALKKSADKMMSFGKQTWPHMMVRVMVMEQLYRAQQILKNHPYHRE